jgi:hypothetical protein
MQQNLHIFAMTLIVIQQRCTVTTVVKHGRHCFMDKFLLYHDHMSSNIENTILQNNKIYVPRARLM